jgi:hypothetical protein
MKKFEIITEADARVLARGETVELTRGGHITPLAADTLKERRITPEQLQEALDKQKAGGGKLGYNLSKWAS